MAKRTPSKPSSTTHAGERLRHQRVDVLGRTLRDMAKVLDTAPIHLSDIETGKRTPSEELLVRIAAAYRLPESELRGAFGKLDSIVADVFRQSPVAAEKAPEFLRKARALSPEQWDKLIKQAEKLGGEDKAS